jgi:hypothetical protein
MAIGGFLQGLGLAYGNNLIQGANLEQKQAQADLMKTEAQQAQMQTQQMQQQMKTRQDIGAFLKSQTDLEGADASQPLNQAKMYTKAAGLAASQGDLASAKEMTDLSKQAQQDALEQTKLVATQQAQKKEILANTAANLPDNPTREQANDLVRKAVDAGVDPTSIPLPGTPGFLAWKNQQQLAGMDSKSRAEFVQKMADTKANRDMKWQEHEDSVDTRRAQMQQTAAFREAEIGLRKEAMADRAQRAPQTIDVGAAKYEYDPDSSVKGERLATDPRYVKLGNKTTATQENNIVAIGGATAEVARNLSQMARFPTGTTNSPFAHITDHGFLESIQKTGSNALTPEQIQMFQTSSSGLSTELSRAMTLGGGRGANQSVINEVKSQTTPNAGDTNLTAAYKISTAAQIALTRMNSTPDPADQKAKATWDATKAQLQQFPTPDQILDAASGKQKQQLEHMQGKYSTLLDKVRDLPTDSSGESSAGTPALPAGFTVDK